MTLSLFLILSLSSGGRDENGCLIMQRGQPIKGLGLSDLRAFSEHSWKDMQRESGGGVGLIEREKDRSEFDCCMMQVSSHPLTTGPVSPMIFSDKLMYRQRDKWIERLEGR